MPLKKLSGYSQKGDSLENDFLFLTSQKNDALQYKQAKHEKYFSIQIKKKFCPRHFVV